MFRRFFVLLFLASYIVGFAPQDSSYTELNIGVGNGQYTYSDCSGEHASHFSDAGIRITKKYKSPWRIGASLSLIPVDDHLALIGYPDLAYDDGNFSFGTTGLRLGYLEKNFFEVKCLDEIPYTTGKGILRIGIGMPITQNGTRFWVGTNRGIFQNWGFGTSLEFPLKMDYSLSLTGRYGTHNSIPEYGISLGLNVRY